MEKSSRLVLVNDQHLDLVLRPLVEAIQVVKKGTVRTTIHSDQAGINQHNKWDCHFKKDKLFSELSQSHLFW